jgi:hypothetical protein
VVRFTHPTKNKTMSPTAENVIERLDGARQKWWLFSLLTTTVLGACASFGVFMAMMLADAVARCSQAWLLGMFLAWLLLTAALVFGVGRRILGGQRSMEATARRVEVEFPELGSQAINLVQLVEDRKNTNRLFCEAAVNQAAAELGQVSFDRAAKRESRWRRLVHCMQTPRDLAEAIVVLAVLIAVAMFCDARIPGWASAASRLLMPWKFTPSVGAVEIVSVAPGDAEVLLGESVEIAAKIKSAQGRPHRAVLLIRPAGGEESPLAMTADESREHYRATVPAVLKAFRYRLEIGDSQTAVYTIGVREKPVIERVEVKFQYPAYLGRKSETLHQTTADLEAPQYTVAELRLRPSTPITEGALESAGDRYAGRVEDEGRLLVASMPLLKDGAYSVRLVNSAGHSDRSPRLNRIAVIPDKPPAVELLKPGRQSTAAPGTTVPVVIRATDDYGIGRLQLEMKIVAAATGTEEADRPHPNPLPEGEGTSRPHPSPLPRGEGTAGPHPNPLPEGEGTESVVKQWTRFAGDSTTAVTRHYSLSLKPETVKPGQTVFIRAVAWDRRAISDWGLELGPQQSASAWHAIKVVAPEAAASATIEQLDGLRAAIAKLLEKQVAARVAAGGMVRMKAVPERTQSSADIRTRQIDIQKTTVNLVGSIGSVDQPEQLAIKRALSALALGEMLQAVARCDELGKIDAGKEFARPAAELTASQDRIISVLRKLLGAIRHAEDDLLKEAKNRAATDLPDDVKRKFEELRDKLAKFLKQQKKVVEASQNLAKKPVEDFTKEEEELLKKMAAAEDDLSKFMNEVKSDLSKLPEQDFANPSTAKELVEIQTELKMAEDALLKKSVDIAVPLEQLGYERAEELLTNLEKWLPDTPDREKWSQEESPSDKDKEAPMAELPGELEDLVGDLMEQEEDLFDEMEDISSSAADSLDKGAGWDAMDGPISNNSAKGVTGNRLPNTSEIAGRSGEGRQGKSSGEMVGDEAVGKGGRKTPSRLTPDPVVKGQIKDHSKDSPGGATGGGKESGKGGEGLQGPTPGKPGPRDAQRLADRQAALRNKAEGIDLQLQVSNFHKTDLKKMIEIMAQVERDLKAGRYQNALRQRHALIDGIGNIKQCLEGEFQVRGDATTNLPADIQKKILGSMDDPSPAGWEELNREYFERLSGGEEEQKAEGIKREKGKGK